MSRSIRLRANAKINIGLHIVGKRSDGYHLMETVYYPIPELYDEVEIALEGESCTVEMLGIDEEIPLESNLCYRAWRLLGEMQGSVLPGVRVRVRKHIPAGAGLGGGSSDAAAVLIGLRELIGLDLDDAALATVGEKLGADVPFFIYNRPLYATGIGTEFRDIALDLAEYRIVVETLPIHSSTPSAFKGLVLSQIPEGRSLWECMKEPVEHWKKEVRNDLLGPVVQRIPEVGNGIQKMYAAGAVYAAMSGSGSAYFGIFPNGN